MFVTITASKEVMPTPASMKGVDTPTLLARIRAVAVQPELAKRHGVSMHSLARIPGATVVEPARAAHFTIATHASDMAALADSHRPCRNSE
jgi:hypothetical protein